MPYTIDRRVTGSHKTTLQYQRGNDPVLNAAHDSGTKYECLYGYRTGSKADLSSVDSRNTYAPPEGASLLEVLAYRKAFIERSVTKIAQRTSAPTHFILSDMGNEFASAKLTAVGTSNSLVHKSGAILTTRTIRNAIPDGTYWLDSTGAMVAGNPFTDFGGYLGSHGVKEFLGTGSHGLSVAQTNGIASRAISAMNPIKSHASVLTTLLELAKGDVPGILKNLRTHYDGIMDLKQVTAKGSLDAANTIGGTPLETVFGWVPIAQDIKAAIQVLTTLDSLLFPPDNTRRKFNTVVHERYGTYAGSAQLQNGSLMTPIGGLSDIGLNSKTSSYISYAGTAPTVYTARETIDVRVTARFNTSLVPSAQSNGYLDKLHVLLGLDLTPQVIWDLLPWSWLVDWFANIGSVVENLGNIHMSNVILNYAYATFRREAVSGAWCRPVLSTGSTGYVSLTGNFITEYKMSQKVRLKASPYGFGTALSSLTGPQWAILTALGLARAR